MGMRVHELHPSVVHSPLSFLPAAAGFDLAAALTGDRGLAKAGKALWWLGAGSGLFAGLAGMASSQEIEAHDKTARDMMWLHGMANVGILAVAFGFAAWRHRNRPSLRSSVLAIAATSTAFYSAYLGGELVYGHGVGLKQMADDARGKPLSPRLLSKEAPATFVRDALAGLKWLFTHVREVKQQGLDRAAVLGADRLDTRPQASLR